MSKESIFHQMASFVKVRHIQSPLGPTFTSDTAVQEVRELYERLKDGPRELLEYPGLFFRDGELTAALSVSNLLTAIEESGPSDWLCECAFIELCEFENRISVTDMVSADLSLLEAIEVLAARNPCRLFLIDGKDIIGHITYGSLFKLPSVMCIFAMMIELEEACLELCRAFPEPCWAALSDGRRDKAMDVWRKRFQHERSREGLAKRLEERGAQVLMHSFIECTTFIDKAKMIGKCKLLIDWPRDKLDSTFNHAEQVRNACAHPADNSSLESLLPRDRFGELLKDCRTLIESIRAVTPRKVPSSSSEG
jgi:hypothetical protein